MIPVLKCRDMQEAILFYTRILDFEIKDPHASPDDWVVDLVNGDATIQLTALEGDTLPACAVNVRVDDVDGLFDKYVERGLNASGREGSPVHQGPLNQSWGMREFYVTDPSGNTLRYGKPIYQ